MTDTQPIDFVIFDFNGTCVRYPSEPFDVSTYHVLKMCPSPKKRYKSETSSTFILLEKHLEWARSENVLTRVKDVST